MYVHYIETKRMTDRTHQKRRDLSRPKTIIGKSVSQGLVSIKGADLTINKYVSRFHTDTTKEALREFISQKNVTVVELEPIPTTHNRYKSFRLRIKRADLDQIENADFWPEGVIVCQYFRPKNMKDQGSTGAIAASPGTQHGIEG